MYGMISSGTNGMAVSQGARQIGTSACSTSARSDVIQLVVPYTTRNIADSRADVIAARHISSRRGVPATP